MAVHEAVASAVRVAKRDGVIGLAKRARVYLADLSECRGFLRSVRHGEIAGPEQVVEMTFSNPAIRPFQVKSEILGLARRVSSLRPRTVLEIGTAQGGTLFILSRCAAPDAVLISLDLPAGRFGGGYPSWRSEIYRSFAVPGQTLHLLRGNSHDAGSMKKVRELLSGSPLDVLFIDGDHTYEGVKQDFELYGPLVRPGGLIALHDIARHPPSVGCNVDLFWAEVRGRFRSEELIENPDQGGKGIGVLWV